MSSVNPALDPALEGAPLRDGVAQLFGTTNAAVVKAVGQFLQSPHGRLDEVNLRFLAAASALLDPNHTASLIQKRKWEPWDACVVVDVRGAR